MITRQTSIKRQVSKRQVSKRHNNNSNTTNYDEEQQQQQKQLEGVEVREMSDGTVVWGVVKKLGKRKSFFIASEDSSDYESKLQVNEEAQDETKGEEEEIDEEDEDEEQIEERVLTLMGLSPDLLKNYPNNINYESAITTPTTPVVTPPPIPKRSPHRLREQKLQRERQQQEQLEQEQATYISSYSNRRDSSTTDVYYAHGATLPSLLEMIASDQGLSPKENPTVEEQLDEVMRSLGYTEGHTL
ncbi:hypothetical protein BDC45DRAFT_508392 [Circinella umbellata]|nr:hypothetical protein BDC45DRAFT_508392 [Circinella umbellata]